MLRYCNYTECIFMACLLITLYFYYMFFLCFVFIIRTFHNYYYHERTSKALKKRIFLGSKKYHHFYNLVLQYRKQRNWEHIIYENILIDFKPKKENWLNCFFFLLLLFQCSYKRNVHCFLYYVCLNFLFYYP